ncbi:hypothetical protein [Synechococcus sp. PCC 6312]|uniref:hypothetical protein n=1 Tax=Synechococcus sp. (strain ATCC 27167 / PCC 6312) TaxID=195253 RepID=UPI00029F3604|nr:hypothetical protein [Synechococcus sp. PCC 6312]AFY59735.1 hypothetical protein Syn6312_0508 [Synechococcus sp. PCC 6312]
MVRRLGFLALWLGFVIYAFGFAPPDQPDTLALIQRLVGGPWAGINPLIIALFNIMGVWPFIYLCVLLVDGRGQKIPAWPFVGGSFALGAFALLPYFVLRNPNPAFRGEMDKGLKLTESRGLAVSLLVGGLALFGYGLTQGNWPDFVHQWHTSRFIHVMSLDFCLLTLLFPAVLGDDLQRRGLGWGSLAWVALIPFFGPLIYLCCRPPLQRTGKVYPEIQNPPLKSV